MIFDLITIDWEALAAIATFSAVAFAFYQHRAHMRREKKEELRDVVEMVIQPLQQELKMLLFNFDEGVFRTTQLWGLHNIMEQKRYLFSRLPKDFKEDIKRFDDKLEFFKNLSTQILPTVQELIGNAVKTALKNSEHGDKLGSHIRQEMARSCYKAEVGGKYLLFYFARFIRENVTFDEAIERFFEENHLPNKKITQEEFILDGIHIRIPGREYFIKTISEIKILIKDNSKVFKYFEKMREIYEVGSRLKAKLEQFLIAL